MLNEEFDGQMQTALAEYQSYKSLRQRDGRMNFETYRAMGEEMNVGQAAAATLNRPVLRLLLANGNFTPDDAPWAGDGANHLPNCAQKAILEFYKANGNSSASRLQLIERTLKNLLVSSTGFPLSTPPGIALSAQAATDAVGGEGTYEKVTGVNPKTIQGYTASATRVYLGNINFSAVNPPFMRTAAGLSLITHEFTHAMQYLEEKNFTANYVKEMLKHGSQRKGGNRFEEKAYINEDKSEKFYLNNPQLMCNENYSN